MSRYQRYDEGCWWRVSGKDHNVYFSGNGVPEFFYSMADLTNTTSADRGTVIAAIVSCSICGDTVSDI